MLILAGVVLLSSFTVTTTQVAPPVADKFVNNQLDTGLKAPSRGPPSAAPPNLATLLTLNSQPENKVVRHPIQDITRNTNDAITTSENSTSTALSTSTTSVPTISTDGKTVAPQTASTTKAPVTTNEPSTKRTPAATTAPSTSATSTTMKTITTTVNTTKTPTTTTDVPSSTAEAPTTTVHERSSSSSEESSEETTSSTTPATSVPSTSSVPTVVTSSNSVPKGTESVESMFSEPDLEGEGTQEFKTNKLEEMNKEVMALSSKFVQNAYNKVLENAQEENVSGSSEVLDKLSEAQELSLLKKIAFNPAIGANAFGVKTLKSEDEAAKIHNIDGSIPSLPPFAFSEDEETEAKVEDISSDNFSKLISDITKTMMANIPTAVVSNGTEEEKVTVDEKKAGPNNKTTEVVVASRVEEKKEEVVVTENKQNTTEAPKEVLKVEKQPEPKKEAERRIGIVPININGDVFTKKETNNNKKVELLNKKKTVFTSAPDAFNTGKNFVPVRLFFDKTNDQTSIIHRKKHTKRRRVTPVPKRLEHSRIVDGSFGSSDPDTTIAPPTSATINPTQPLGIQTEKMPVVEVVTPSIRTTHRPNTGKKRKNKVGRSRGLSKSTELLEHFESSSIGPVGRTDDFLIARPEHVPLAPVSDRELLQKRFEELENKQMKIQKSEEKKIKTPKEMVLPDLVTMPDLRILNTFSTLRGPAHITGQSNRVVNRRSNEADIDWKKTYGYKGKRKVIRVRKLKKKNIEADVKQDKAILGQKVDSKQVQHGKYFGKWGKAKIRPRFIKKKLTTTLAPPTSQTQPGSRLAFTPLQPQLQPAPQLPVFQNQGGFFTPPSNSVPSFNFFQPAINNGPMQPQTQLQGRQLFNNPSLFNPTPQGPQARLFNTPPQQQLRLPQTFNSAPPSQGQLQGLAPVARDTVPTGASRQIPQYLGADGRWYPYVNNQPTLPQQVQPVIYAPQQRSTMPPLVAEQVAQMVGRPVQNAAAVPTVKRSRSATISSESRKLKQTGLGRRHRRGHRKLKRSRHAKARSGGKTVKIHRVPKTHMGEVDKGSSSFSSNQDDRPILVDRDLARKTIDRDVRRR